jgi:hypothetical protein
MAKNTTALKKEDKNEIRKKHENY